MSAGAFFAALTNLLLIVAIDPWHAIAARFLTGCALAFVYPPALKYISTWFRKARGIAMGFIVGSLTIGSALPHFINGLGSQENFYFYFRNYIYECCSSTGRGDILVFARRSIFLWESECRC